MIKTQIKDLELVSSDFSLATDFYELTMAAAYFKSNQKDKRAIFELFVRKLPRNRSYMTVAGLEQSLVYLETLRFGKQEISFLKSHKSFSKLGNDFFSYLKRFKFTGDVWAVPEGSILFPNEPILRVEGPIIEAQIVETFLLSMINFQSLIATKASRITNISGDKDVVEFGSRRAHGPQAALLGARASYIGGCVGTSNTLAGYKFGIPVFGTMAHSYVMSFDKELDSFEEFNKVFPKGMILVDTYDTLKAVNKIVQSGIRITGIRLDSGDLHSLAVQSRKILDKAGLKDVKIMASGDLDENIISNLIKHGSPIDIFGVGTELSTSRDDPAMNGVYKLVAIKNIISKNKYEVIPKLKTSIGKLTYPGSKQIYRIYQDGKILQDIIGLEDEKFNEKNPVPLLKKVMSKGKICYKLPSVKKIRDYHLLQRETLPKEFRTLEKSRELFPVSYSERLELMAREFRHQ
jgi:nicotinate phosphoribosyltransferase